MKAVAVTMLLMIFLVVTESVAASRVINEGEVVLDSTGKPVEPDRPYLIQVPSSPGQYVTQDKQLSGASCPQAAVLSSLPKRVVLLQKSVQPNILVNTDITIRFDEPDACPETGVWKVDRSPIDPKLQDIPTRGYAFDKDSTFKIQKYADDTNGVYKFVYNHQDIGVAEDPRTGVKHLALNKTPLDVTFVPANGPTTSTFLKMY